MLYCPKCTDIRLVSRSLEHLPYLWCYKCDGFSLLGRISQNALQKSLIKDFNLKKNSLPDAKNRICSCCKKNLKAYKIQNSIEIDLCARCYFLFLDKDEYKSLTLNTKHEHLDETRIEIQAVNIFDYKLVTNLEQLLLDYPTMDIKEKPHHTQPIISWVIVAITLIIYKNPHLANSLIWHSKNPSIGSMIGSFFTHFKLRTLIANISFFLIFATKLERFIGTKEFLKFLLGVMIILLLLNKFLLKDSLFIGFSGLTFASMAAIACLLPKARFSFISIFQYHSHIPTALKMELPLHYYIFLATIIMFDEASGTYQYHHVIYGFLGFLVGYIYTYKMIRLNFK